MQRRAFIGGFILLGGGLALQRITGGVSGSVGKPMDPASFSELTKGVQLKYLAPDLLSKIMDKRIHEEDRARLAAELVSHNRNLFVAKAYERQHGAPGFYRIIE